jgi:uncharacterized protein YcsI (UPF0317 family)
LETATTIDRRPARDLRLACRTGEFRQPTTGFAPGFAQANLLVLPQADAFDFLLFCQRNPKPCPLLEVTQPGDPEPKQFAPGADLRTDLPLYRVYRDGVLVAEVPDVREFWRPDLVAFLLGCSFSFETALLRAGLGVRQLEETLPNGTPKNVPMYRTNIPCRSAGKFSGPLVVSMRPYTPADAVKAAVVTSRFPSVHGAPIQIGDPEAIGITHLGHPDWGDAVTIRAGEVPVFWACGVTPQAAVMQSKPVYAIAHSPGHMFVTDVMDEELAT